jgi:hypothetical protein
MFVQGNNAYIQRDTNILLKLGLISVQIILQTGKIVMLYLINNLH